MIPKADGSRRRKGDGVWHGVVPRSRGPRRGLLEKTVTPELSVAERFPPAATKNTVSTSEAFPAYGGWIRRSARRTARSPTGRGESHQHRDGKQQGTRILQHRDLPGGILEHGIVTGEMGSGPSQRRTHARLVLTLEKGDQISPDAVPQNGGGRYSPGRPRRAGRAFRRQSAGRPAAGAGERADDAVAAHGHRRQPPGTRPTEQVDENGLGEVVQAVPGDDHLSGRRGSLGCLASGRRGLGTPGWLRPPRVRTAR